MDIFFLGGGGKEMYVHIMNLPYVVIDNLYKK